MLTKSQWKMVAIAGVVSTIAIWAANNIEAYENVVSDGDSWF